MGLRILIADDHKIIREGLCHLFEQQPDMEVIGEAENGRVAIQLIRKLNPDVVILDVCMPELNGVDAARQIKKEFPNIKLIALSMHTDRRFVEGMLAVGASAYVLKEGAFEELVHAIQCARRKRSYVSPKITNIIIKKYLSHLDNCVSGRRTLTDREREVLQLISEGKKTKQIAGILYLSIKTIETHRRTIMDKLNVGSIAELTKYAIREGLTPLEA